MWGESARFQYYRYKSEITSTGRILTWFCFRSLLQFGAVVSISLLFVLEYVLCLFVSLQANSQSTQCHCWWLVFGGWCCSCNQRTNHFVCELNKCELSIHEALAITLVSTFLFISLSRRFFCYFLFFYSFHLDSFCLAWLWFFSLAALWLVQSIYSKIMWNAVENLDTNTPQSMNTVGWTAVAAKATATATNKRIECNKNIMGL